MGQQDPGSGKKKKGYKIRRESHSFARSFNLWTVSSGFRTLVFHTIYQQPIRLASLVPFFRKSLLPIHLSHTRFMSSPRSWACISFTPDTRKNLQNTHRVNRWSTNSLPDPQSTQIGSSNQPLLTSLSRVSIFFF